MTPNQIRPTALLALLLASSPIALFAQTPGTAGSQPVQQPLLLPPALPPALPSAPAIIEADDLTLARRAAAEGDHAEALARFLRVLAQRPRDLEALSGAGQAALHIGDSNGALNFYARAEEIAPANGRVKAGLGSTMNQLLQPGHALRFFEEAVQLGVPVHEIAGERGLAYDLRGDNRRARIDYEMALRFDPGHAETTRRLAASQAMGGDMLGALATLDKLLRRQDSAAWRMRAFVLAISGDLKGAQETASSVLPRQQADALAPFLQRLGKLKPAQQAAAVHFGVFPTNGRTPSEQELLAVRDRMPEPVLSSSNLKQAAERIERERAERAVREKAEQAERSRAEQAERERAERERAALAQHAAHSDELGDGVEDLPEPALPTPPARLARAPAAPPPAPAGRSSTSQQQAAAPAPTPAPAAKATPPGASTAAAKPAKDKDSSKAATASKAGNAKEPERHWVQIATGAYKPDLGKEWTRLKEKYPALLGRSTPWTVPLNRTNRLMVGPFKSAAEAQAFVNKAAGAGFITSPVKTNAGQAVERVKN